LPAKIINSKTFKGIIVVEIKDKLSLKILEDKLVNLIKLAIPEKKVKKLREITLKAIFLSAIFLSARGYNKYI